jgi:hypothetical protein
MCRHYCSSNISMAVAGPVAAAAAAVAVAGLPSTVGDNGFDNDNTEGPIASLP